MGILGKILLIISIAFTIGHADFTSSLATGVVQGLINANQKPPPKKRYYAPKKKRSSHKKKSTRSLSDKSPNIHPKFLKLF